MHVNIKFYRCLLHVSVRSQYHANNMQNKYKYTKKLLKKYMHTTSKRITRCKQNTHTLQRKLQHAAKKPPACCKQKNYTLQTKLQHVANKRITHCKQTSHTLQRKFQHAANKSKSTAHAGWGKRLGPCLMVLIGRSFYRERLTRVSWKLRPLKFFF